MTAETNTLEEAKAVLSALKDKNDDTTDFYNNWAENYDQHVAVLDYNAPRLAATGLSSHFTGDREAALVLDVACGTGLVAKQLKEHGFKHFVGIDGSKGMLDLAKKTDLYQDLKQCMLGKEPLPVQWGLFDVVVIVGALTVNHVPFTVVRELCKAAKPGGYICLGKGNYLDSKKYTIEMELLLKQMEEEELWSCVSIDEMKNWMTSDIAEQGKEDKVSKPGTVYIYRKL
ncbi:methyltransferase-like protein 27 [Genypterus blacodes]|uniref:methyltransferase-like protein 27 n=1 Tax=Genypterus blacodes TaxID=154954 RepID=UPI003F75F5E1